MIRPLRKLEMVNCPLSICLKRIKKKIRWLTFFYFIFLYKQHIHHITCTEQYKHITSVNDSWPTINLNSQQNCVGSKCTSLQFLFYKDKSKAKPALNDINIFRCLMAAHSSKWLFIVLRIQKYKVCKYDVPQPPVQLTYSHNYNATMS